MAKTSSTRTPSVPALPLDVAKHQKDLKRAVVRVQNLMLRGGGAGQPPADRGAAQSAAPVQSMHPYDVTNWLWRYQEYTRWYFKAWEARKLVDIPPDDASRIPFRIIGIDQADAAALVKDWQKLNGTIQIRRAEKQRRLLGGCAIYMRLADCEMTDKDSGPDKPVNWEVLQRNKSGFESLNLVDINRITRGTIEFDPLAKNYDKPQYYNIDGRPVHISRLVVLDGEPMFNRQNVNILQLGHVNPAGFGESVLCQVYDDLVRVTGTREGAYHLINMASVLLACLKDYKILGSTKPGEAAMIATAEVVNLINLYRAAILDASNIELKQHSATFGSVPELLMMFLQILSAAADIPATRFLGQAPGGLNATGESDLENYYNMIDAYQEETLKPRMLKIFDPLGVCRYGMDQWSRMREIMDIEYPPLWNLKQTDQAVIIKNLIEAWKPLLDAKIMTAKMLEGELKARRLFLTPVELKEMIEKPLENPLAKPATFAGKPGEQPKEGEKPNGI